MEKNDRRFLTVALALLLLANVWQSYQISKLSLQLSTAKYELQSAVQAVNSRLDEVQRTADEANRIVEQYTIAPTGIDSGKKALLADVSVALRSYQADTQVTLLTNSAQGPQESPMTQTGEGLYTALAALPLTGDEPVDFTLAVDNGGTVTRKEIGGESTAALLPVHLGQKGSSESKWTANRSFEIVNYAVSFADGLGNPIAVNDPEFRLYHNTKLVASMPGVLDETGDMFYSSGAWERLSVKAGDGVRLTVACTDEFGLGYEFTLDVWHVQGVGVSKSEDGIIDVYPTLTWPTT